MVSSTSHHTKSKNPISNLEVRPETWKSNRKPGNPTGRWNNPTGELEMRPENGKVRPEDGITRPESWKFNRKSG